MEENLTANKEGVLDERVKEIEESGNYVQIKITVPTLPEEILQEIGYRVSNKKGEIAFSQFLSEVSDYIEEHVDYNPIFNISGKNVSNMDRMISLALAREMIGAELMDTYAETKSDNGGDE